MPDARALSVPARTLADYQKQQGFAALQKARGRATAADDILNDVRAAKLRGRGGAGALTADKWQVVRDAVAKRGGPAYLVCNAYDADSRSQAAASLLANQPFLVIEGIILTALAVGAQEAYLYMRSTNNAGHEAVSAALLQTQDAGYMSGVAITIVGVDVGIMGGEESTMLEVIKGRRAMAQQRPPFPAQSGLFEMPTAVDNVETLAQVAVIMRDGPASFTKTGTKATAGTKLVTVIDPQGQAHLIDAPFGATIAEIVRQAGVSADGARGIVVGGPEGGVLPPNLWNTAFDFDTLRDVGTIVGSGVIEVLAADTCMVAWSAARMNVLARESCGKCIPCRTGTKRVAGTIEGIISDVGNAKDLDLLTEFGDYIPDGSLCGFGWNATHPLKTAMQYYADDFQKHLGGECPTGTCIPVRSHRFATKDVLGF